MSEQGNDGRLTFLLFAFVCAQSKVGNGSMSVEDQEICLAYITSHMTPPTDLLERCYKHAVQSHLEVSAWCGLDPWDHETVMTNWLNHGEPTPTRIGRVVTIRDLMIEVAYEDGGAKRPVFNIYELVLAIGDRIITHNNSVIMTIGEPVLG